MVKRPEDMKSGDERRMVTGVLLSLSVATAALLAATATSAESTPWAASVSKGLVASRVSAEPTLPDPLILRSSTGHQGSMMQHASHSSHSSHRSHHSHRSHYSSS